MDICMCLNCQLYHY